MRRSIRSTDRVECFLNIVAMAIVAVGFSLRGEVINGKDPITLNSGHLKVWLHSYKNPEL
jgi:hypothetical protein